jgi:deazaflavin-dependent oxidoreductase (nitroreductase family)
MNQYARLLSAFGQTPFGAWCVKHILSRIDPWIYRWSKGRMVGVGPMVFPTLLLITTGRKSGKERTTPLIYLRDGEDLIVGSSNVGMKQPAAWPLNVEANPDVRVQLGATIKPYSARVGTADEIERYWPQFAAIYPPFATYAVRAGVRKLFILSPRP